MDSYFRTHNLQLFFKFN